MVTPWRPAFRATLAPKRELDWFVGKKNVVHGDLRRTFKKCKIRPDPPVPIPLDGGTKQLALVDPVPQGSRPKGEGKPRMARGKCKLNDLGEMRLYIYKNKPPYIRNKQDEVYIFYYDQNPERMKVKEPAAQYALQALSFAVVEVRSTSTRRQRHLRLTIE